MKSIKCQSRYILSNVSEGAFFSTIKDENNLSYLEPNLSNLKPASLLFCIIYSASNEEEGQGFLFYFLQVTEVLILTTAN